MLKVVFTRDCPGTKCKAHMCPLPLTLSLSEQMFQKAHLLMMENDYANLY